MRLKTSSMMVSGMKSSEPASANRSMNACLGPRAASMSFSYHLFSELVSWRTPREARTASSVTPLSSSLISMTRAAISLLQSVQASAMSFSSPLTRACAKRWAVSVRLMVMGICFSPLLRGMP